jgi:uncharacterized protein
MKIDTQRILTRFPESVSNIINNLKSIKSIHRLILFGSRVHDDSEEKSDFDIAVDLGIQSHLEFLKIKDRIENENNSLYFISLVDYNSSPKNLKDIINKSGVLIYESKKDT